MSYEPGIFAGQKRTALVYTFPNAVPLVGKERRWKQVTIALLVCSGVHPDYGFSISRRCLANSVGHLASLTKQPGDPVRGALGDGADLIAQHASVAVYMTEMFGVLMADAFATQYRHP